MTASLARIDSAPQSTSLARFQPQNLEQAMQVSEMLSRAGDLIPAHLQGKPAAVLATMLAGAELGIGMMESFRAIYLVKGKVGFYADFMLAKAKGHPRCVRFDMVESSADVATFETEEKGGKVTPMSFTMREAHEQGLTRNPVYKTNPAAMLRARCISALVKVVYPDSFFGSYSMEEVQEIEAMEKELNPPPPVARQATLPVEVPSVKPLSGVRATVEKMKAKTKPAPLVVDVAMGETEEEAKSKATQPEAKAQNKLAEHTDGELLDLAAQGERYLAAQPGGQYALAWKRTLGAVSLELDKRSVANSAAE